jgi:hypothetical protein
MKIMKWKQDFCVSQIGTAVKRIEFVSDRMSYVVLTLRWCNIIVMNVHAPSEEKSDDCKDSFYGELDKECYNFHKCHVRKFYKEILMQKCGEIIFSNRQFGMRVNMRIVMVRL